MNAFAIVQQIKNHVHDPKRRKPNATPLQRQTQIVNSVLNAFLGWLDDRDYVSIGFPTKPNAITSFSPALRAEVSVYDRDQAKAKAQTANQRRLEKAAARRRGDRTAPALRQPQLPITYVPRPPTIAPTLSAQPPDPVDIDAATDDAADDAGI